MVAFDVDSGDADRLAMLAGAAPGSAQVQAAVAQGILSLIILDAVACFAVRGLFWSVMILLLLVPAMYFGKWI